MNEAVEQNSTEGCSFCLPWKNFGETMKSTQYFIIFIFYASLENVIIFVRVWLFRQMKNIPRLGQICFYTKTMLMASSQLCKKVSLHKWLL